MSDLFLFKKDDFIGARSGSRTDNREEPVDDGMLVIDMHVDVFGEDRVVHLPTNDLRDGIDADVPDCIIWDIDTANIV